MVNIFIDVELCESLVVQHTLVLVAPWDCHTVLTRLEELENGYQVNCPKNVVEGNDPHSQLASPHGPFDYCHPCVFIWRGINDIIVMHQGTCMRSMVVVKREE